VARLVDAKIGPRDLVAVLDGPEPTWLELVPEIWDAGAALLPVDPRLAPGEVSSLIARARPTLILRADAWERRRDGLRPETGVALVVHTSGTGGLPKLACFTRRALLAAVRGSAAALGSSSDDPWLCCLPVAHVGGLLVLLRGVLLEAPVVVHPRFDPGMVAAEPDLAYVSLVPTMLARLLDAGVDVARFAAILVGGAPLPATLRLRAEAAGARPVETYGLPGSCGGVVYEGRPFPEVGLRLDPEGRIELGGPTLMLGYHLDPAGTQRAFAADGWLRTGDAGEVDPEGRLRVLGRADGVISTGGEKVWPEEVEAVLRDHPEVAEVLVRGRADPEWGERIVAYVVPRAGGELPTLEDLRGFASRRLARHKSPRELVLVPELPRTSSGKVRRSGSSAQE